MGWLQHRAIRGMEKRLRPFMRPDERVEGADVCTVLLQPHDDDSPFPPMDRTAVVVTSHAAYVQPHRSETVVRAAYEEILRLQRSGGTVVFQTRNATVQVIPAGREWLDLYEAIGAKLRRLEVFHLEVDVPGGYVRAVLRPVADGGEPVWITSAPAEVDFDRLEVRSAVEDAVPNSLRRMYGLPGPLREPDA